MRFVVLTLALAMPSAPRAQAAEGYVLDVEPSRPSEMMPVVARVQVTQCILLPAAANVVRAGNAIAVRMDIVDFCQPSLVVPERRYDLGALAAGTYVLSLEECGLTNAGYACRPVITRNLSVSTLREAAIRVPGLRGFGLGVLASILLWAGSRRRS